MTKKVRVENADNSAYKILVEVWDKGYPEGEPDRLVETHHLAYPARLTPESLYITSTRYLIVKEEV